jgi:hypothetical protein
MSTTIIKTVQDWEDRLSELVDQVQEPVLKFSGEIADSVGEYAPERPDWPVLRQLPTVAEVVDFQLAFAHRYVDTQSTFARSLLKVWQPVLGKFEPKAEPTRKPRNATKAAAA